MKSSYAFDLVTDCLKHSLYFNTEQAHWEERQTHSFCLVRLKPQSEGLWSATLIVLLDPNTGFHKWSKHFWKVRFVTEPSAEHFKSCCGRKSHKSFPHNRKTESAVQYWCHLLGSIGLSLQGQCHKAYLCFREIFLWEFSPTGWASQTRPAALRTLEKFHSMPNLEVHV